VLRVKPDVMPGIADKFTRLRRATQLAGQDELNSCCHASRFSTVPKPVGEIARACDRLVAGSTLASAFEIRTAPPVGALGADPEVCNRLRWRRNVEHAVRRATMAVAVESEP